MLDWRFRIKRIRDFLGNFSEDLIENESFFVIYKYTKKL
jgi:hypothetical protein